MSFDRVKEMHPPKPTIEGAGVKLQRAFGFGNTTDFDPFLLFDDFRNDNPTDYLAGFPWHPHRGIETITYVLAGDVEHGDSLGNRGSLGAGDVQWMTAGQRHPAPGDAEGRRAGPHARLPAVGQPAGVAEDDEAALPGREGAGHSRSHRRRRHRVRASSSASSGARRGRWTASRPSRATSTSSVPPGRRSGSPSSVASRVRVRLRRLGHVPRRVGAAGGARPS